MEKALALIVAVSCSAMAVSQILRNCAIEYAILFVAMAVCCISMAVYIFRQKK